MNYRHEICELLEIRGVFRTSKTLPLATGLCGYAENTLRETQLRLLCTCVIFVIRSGQFMRTNVRWVGPGCVIYNVGCVKQFGPMSISKMDRYRECVVLSLDIARSATCNDALLRCFTAISRRLF